MNKTWFNISTFIIISFFITSCSLAETIKTITTQDGTRIQQVAKGSLNQNWIYVPGGPGIGSDYFLPLIEQLTIDSNHWLLDLPGNGSNHKLPKNYDFSQWAESLTTAIQELEQVVLITHSFSSTLALTHEPLFKHIEGLIILNSAPNTETFIQAEKRALSKQEQQWRENALNAYIKSPSNQTFKDFVVAGSVYFFNKEDVKKGSQWLNQIPVDYRPHQWANQAFFDNYSATAIPTTIPVLIVGSHQDQISPISGFLKDERFQRNNIQISIIDGASHFPWIDHLKEVSLYLEKFQETLH